MMTKEDICVGETAHISFNTTGSSPWEFTFTNGIHLEHVKTEVCSCLSFLLLGM
jgi:hypothetical protein